MCCLIYKVLFCFFATAHRDSLFSISYCLSFVKHFFQLFSKSFFVLAALATACISYHITSALSIPFFKLFPKLFQAFSSSFSSILHRLICDSLHILSYPQPFVNTFCTIFSIFFVYFNLSTAFHTFSTTLSTVCSEIWV